MNCGAKSGEPRSSERSEILPELLVSVFVLFCLFVFFFVEAQYF